MYKCIETFDYNTESWVGEAISKEMRRHQNAKCFNCGRIGHLKRDCRQGVPRNNVSSGNGKNKSINLLYYMGSVAKANIWSINVDQWKTDKVTWYHKEPPWGPQVKRDIFIPSHCGGHVSPGKFKNPLPAVKKKPVLFWMVE